MNNFTRTVIADTQRITNVTRQQAAVQARIAQQSEAAKLRDFQRSINEIARNEQRRIAETVRSANQRLREEQRAAREVERINRETARQAEQQSRLRERAAKTLADVQIREAKRAARELERSIASSGGGSGGDGGGGFDPALLGLLASRVPSVGRLTSELSAVSSAAGGAGASIAAIAAPVVLAAAEMAILATIASKVTQNLFDLAKQAAEFQGNLFDMSQQVGVSVETLSALEVLAKTTGGSIETVAASLAIFQRNLEDAEDPTSKEAKLLAQLGVTSRDTEQALRQTLRGLFEMGEGAEQTTAALTLFGRSGRFINAILKESHGDLDAAIERFRQLGIVVSTDAARAADEFNDNLALVEFQIRSLSASIGNQIIPVVIDALESLKKTLEDNKDTIETFGVVARGLARFIAEHFKGAFLIASGVLEAHAVGVRVLVDLYERLAAAMQLVTGNIPEVDPNAIPVQPLGEGPGSALELLRQAQDAFLKARDAGLKPFNLREIFPDNTKEAAARAAKDLALQQQAIEERTRVHRQELESQRELDLKSIDEWEKDAKAIALRHLANQQSLFEQEIANARRFITNREDLSLALREIDQKDDKAQNEFLDSVTRTRQEAQKRRDQAELELNQQLLTIRDAVREGELDALKADLDRGYITQFVAKEREIALAKQAFNDRKVLRDLELDQITTTAARKSQLGNEQIADEIRLTNEVTRLTRERIKALGDEAAARVGAPGGPVKISPIIPIDLGPPPELTLWEHAFQRLREQMVEFSSFVRGTFLGAFKDISDALAQGVIAWALYGESFGRAMKQALAHVAAKIAAEATMQAILHAAYAVGSLAFGDFRGAAQHGLAAAKFAAVAAVAAVGARQLAGSASTGSTFQQPSGGGAGSGDRNRERDPIDLNRQRQTELHVIFHVEPGKNYREDILRTVIDDIRTNGDTRQVIKREVNA